MAKPILVGESNPYGSAPAYAFYPAPDGCAGHRLCHLILGMTVKEYLHWFDRVNLCGIKWSLTEARRQADQLLSISESRRFVLCGSRVCKAFDLVFEPFTLGHLEVNSNGVSRHTYVILPHPSGRNRQWGQLGSVSKARRAIADLCPEMPIPKVKKLRLVNE